MGSAEIFAAVSCADGCQALVEHACDYSWRCASCQKRARRCKVPCASRVPEIRPGEAYSYEGERKLSGRFCDNVRFVLLAGQYVCLPKHARRSLLGVR